MYPFCSPWLSSPLRMSSLLLTAERRTVRPLTGQTGRQLFTMNSPGPFFVLLNVSICSKKENFSHSSQFTISLAMEPSILSGRLGGSLCIAEYNFCLYMMSVKAYRFCRWPDKYVGRGNKVGLSKIRKHTAQTYEMFNTSNKEAHLRNFTNLSFGQLHRCLKNYPRDILG